MVCVWVLWDLLPGLGPDKLIVGSVSLNFFCYGILHSLSLSQTYTHTKPSVLLLFLHIVKGARAGYKAVIWLAYCLDLVIWLPESVQMVFGECVAFSVVRCLGKVCFAFPLIET